MQVLVDLKRLVPVPVIFFGNGCRFRCRFPGKVPVSASSPKKKKCTISDVMVYSTYIPRCRCRFQFFVLVPGVGADAGTMYFFCVCRCWCRCEIVLLVLVPVPDSSADGNRIIGAGASVS